MTTQKVSAREATQKAIEGLRQYPDFLDEELREIGADSKWSVEHKRQLSAERQAYWTDAAFKHAKATAKSAQARLALAEAELKRVAAEHDKNINWSRLAVLQTELAARLAAPENTLAGDTALGRIEKLRSQYQAHGDAEALRALRAVVTPHLSRAGDDQRAIRLRRELAEDEERELAPVRTAEREHDDARAGFETIRKTVLDLETRLTGASSSGIFATPTTWQREIFNETPETLGLIGGKRSQAVPEPALADE